MERFDLWTILADTGTDMEVTPTGTSTAVVTLKGGAYKAFWGSCELLKRQHGVYIQNYMELDRSTPDSISFSVVFDQRLLPALMIDGIGVVFAFDADLKKGDKLAIVGVRCHTEGVYDVLREGA